MGKRSKGREYAMLSLFAGFSAETEAEETLEFLRKQRRPSAEVQEFALQLVRGVEENLAQIDEVIESNLSRWSLNRVGLPEKTVLRIAVYELLYSEVLPVPVIVAEALRLVGDYAGEESLSFVNGVLASSASQIRGEDGQDLEPQIEFHFEDDEDEEEELDFETEESEDE